MARRRFTILVACFGLAACVQAGSDVEVVRGAGDPAAANRIPGARYEPPPSGVERRSPPASSVARRRAEPIPVAELSAPRREVERDPAAPGQGPHPTARGRVEGGSPGQVQVKRGDTLYSIARREGVELRALIDANGLAPPYRITPGQSLRLPGVRLYVVERGDTLYGVSRRFGSDVASFAALNRLGPPYALTPGQKLRLPGERAEPAQAASTASFDARSDARASTGGSRTPSSENSGGGSGGSAPARPRTNTPIAPPPRTSAQFAWPVEGDVIATFGPKGRGLQNDGVNIAAPKGAPVKAADDGKVVYVGDGVKGYGNLILVQHADGWLTAYAHLDQATTRDGAIVRRGETIGRVGETGSVTRPQLHFETRRKSAVVDPLTQLPRRAG